MPNWKTYESSVRLLSAIVAAHPELKLNYQELSKCFGGDATKSAMENRFRRIKSDAQLIKASIAKGLDPINISIGEGDGIAHRKGGRGEISKHMGSDTTEGGIGFQFRRIKAGAKAQQAAVKAGKDPKDVDVDPKSKEISKFMGKDTTPNGIKFQMTDRFRPLAKRQLDAVARGEDPQYLEISAKAGKEVSRCFGSDATAIAIAQQFQKTFKAGAKLQLDALARGKDPKDADFENGLKRVTSVRKPRTTDVNCNPAAFCCCFSSKGADMYRHFSTDLFVSKASDLVFKFVESSAKLQRMYTTTCRILRTWTLRLSPNCHTSYEMAPLYICCLEFSFRQFIVFQSTFEVIETRDIDFILAIARLCGSDVTPKAISEQISKVIKPRGHLLQTTLDNGKDPKDLDFGTLPTYLPAASSSKTKEIAKFYPEATASALDHRFRPIKKAAAELRVAYASGGTAAVADKYGEGVTGRAVSERFFRLKKEPAWNLDLTENADGGAVRTPKKTRTPKKNKVAIAEDEDEDDDENEFPSPSKKSGLNKVKNGRVSKPSPRKGANGLSSFISLDSDSTAKDEVGGDSMLTSFENSHSFNHDDDGWAHPDPASFDNEDQYHYDEDRNEA
ncbi:hypothetical protein BP6252_08043 [Coleophoma cylindrospora]|uniref:Uncharacterized protein n=1 Tax=Coleophoma cylindrospora TaxID=1849047 RepID=A0A3D8RBW9_9HELO|nr:hypothetical protein BP6252_08043 [Coleophoma cylindrospora]